MMVSRAVGGVVLGWISAVMCGMLGFAWLAGTVEGAGSRGMGALWTVLLQLPEMAVQLGPICCGLGASLAAVRMAARGEALALHAVGVGPWRSGRVVLGVGLGVGILLFLVTDHGLHRLEPAVGTRTSAEGWIWLEDAAVRLEDGLRVEVDGGSLGSFERQERPVELDASMMQALRAQRPQTAPGSIVWCGKSEALQAEAMVRGGRVIGCGLLALLGWLPWVRSRGGRIGAALGAGLAWQVSQVACLGLCTQGQLDPFWVGLVPTVLLCLLLAVAWWREDPTPP